MTTPFSTYSFHPLEAVLLGNVILLPMLLHDFSFAALLSLPVMSLLLNNLGHSNYDFAPAAGHDHWLSASRRHHLHHIRYHGNYGRDALTDWAGDIRRWREEGRDVWCFFDNDVKSAAPADADRLLALLR